MYSKWNKEIYSFDRSVTHSTASLATIIKNVQKISE